jgi:hypothetical protein
MMLLRIVSGIVALSVLWAGVVLGRILAARHVNWVRRMRWLVAGLATYGSLSFVRRYRRDQLADLPAPVRLVESARAVTQVVPTRYIVTKAERIRFLPVVALVLVVLFADGCSRYDSLPPNDPAVIAYGYGPQPNRKVKYQPDVVMIGGGPRAIRGVTKDNLTWTIDGGANGADQLSVGKIMFASSMAVGRVTALVRNGKNLAVTIAPVQLTEVVRDGTFDINTDIDSKLLADEQAPQLLLPGPPTGEQHDPVIQPAVWRPSIGRPHLRRVGDLPDAMKNTLKVKVGNWEIEPYFKIKGEKATVFDDSIKDEYANNPPRIPELPPDTKDELRQAEIGMKVLYNAYAGEGVSDTDVKPPGGKKPDKPGEAKMGLKFGYSVRLYGQNIHIRSHLAIADGKVDEPVTFVVDGIDRMHLGFFGGSERGVEDNVKARIEVPWDRIIPLPINGFPLALHVKFKFLVETAFSGANSTMWAGGDYKLVGAIGIDRGSVLTPTIEVLKPMSDNMHGIAVGVSGIVVANEIRILAGLGNAAFVSGFYSKTIFTFATVKGSFLGFFLAGPLSSPFGDAGGTMGMASRCRGIKVKGDTGGGIAIVIDKSVAPGFEVKGAAVNVTEFELFEKMGTFFDKEYRVGCLAAGN